MRTCYLLNSTLLAKTWTVAPQAASGLVSSNCLPWQFLNRLPVIAFKCHLNVIFVVRESGCVLRISSTEPLEITSPPQNAVAEAGTSVDLTCGADQPYDGFFEWRAYIDGSFAGHQVCSIIHSQFTAKYDKYRQFGNFGLTIDHVHWRDGGKYSCAFLSAGDVRAEANVLIIGQSKELHNKLCRRRQPQYAPSPVTLTFDLLTLKVVFESRATWATSVPILVFLGLSVLDLGQMYATVRQTSDAHHRLMPPAQGRIKAQAN